MSSLYATGIKKCKGSTAR